LCMPSTSLWYLCLLFFFKPFTSFGWFAKQIPTNTTYRQDLQHIRFLKERKVRQLGDRCNHPCTSWQKLEAFHQPPFFAPNCRSPNAGNVKKTHVMGAATAPPAFVVDFQRQASCESEVHEGKRCEFVEHFHECWSMMSIGWAWKEWEQSVDKIWGDDDKLLVYWHLLLEHRSLRWNLAKHDLGVG
jgi:hypothetical protein